MVPELKRRLLNLALPLLRTYIRYAPFRLGKRLIWRWFIEPFFYLRSHKFVGSTVFGMRISGNTKDTIQAFIYFFGIWEPSLTRWLQKRLAPGDTFVDVGANIGYYSLLASKLVGDSGSVVAIEPSPRIFKALQYNLALNNIKNVRTVNMAVSDREEVLRLFLGPDWNVGQTTTHRKPEEPGFKFETDVNSAPLSRILRLEEMQNARVIKIDVEGAEWAVASGMRPLFGCCRTDMEIVIEIVPEFLAPQGKLPEDVLKIFLDAGLHPYVLEPEYDPQDYLWEKEIRPTRMRKPMQHETSVVLSRHDSEVI